MKRHPVALLLSAPVLLGALAMACAGPSAGQEDAPPVGQERPELPPSMAAQRALAQEAISGERAHALVASLDPSYRVPGNAAFDAAIYKVVEALEAAGYEDEASGSAGRATYRIERRALERPTWEPVAGSLTIVGQETPLLTLDTNLNLVASRSFSTPGGGVEAELVDVGRGSSEELEGLDLRGKIVLGDGSTGQLFRSAVQGGGALGVLAYRLSTFSHPDVNRDIAAESSVSYDPEARAWGLALTTNARDALRAALATGPVRVAVNVETRIYPSEELTLVADVHGSTNPHERLVFSAHVQESGTNDNLTGVAALAEIAQALGAGVQAGSYDPPRTISMIWGDEISSTRRYLQEDSLRTTGVRWGISLDMVGEDTEKTGGTFLIEKMPDPSAVWTRGDDHHTEWGGRPLTTDRLTPHYFNDFILNRCLDQAAETGWVVKTNPYEGGSDHVPFLQAGVPGLLLWHFTDQFYHTDGDRIEMVSAQTLENVSVCATTAAMALTTADAEVAIFLTGEVEMAALERIATEGELSRASMRAGALADEERIILETWTQWYDAAVEALADVEVGGASERVLARIQEARQRIGEAGRREVESLGGALP